MYTIVTLNTSAYWAATFAAQSGGTFWETVKVNLVEGQIASLAWAWDHGRVFQTAGLFMAGMLIGRQGWFLRHNLHRWGPVLAAAICGFFPLYGLNNMVGSFIDNPNILTSLGIILSSLANLCFMLMLVSGIIFAYYKTSGLSRVLDSLRPYGRMSMTNYVTQGIIGSALYYHWGGIPAGWHHGQRAHRHSYFPGAIPAMLHLGAPPQPRAPRIPLAPSHLARMALKRS